MKSALGVLVTALLVGSLAGCSVPNVATPGGSAGSAIELEGPAGDVFVRIDAAALQAPSFSFDTANPDDPFYHFRTQQSDLSLTIELHPESGEGWTGQNGTYLADCTGNGICIYLDVDGDGPEPRLGPATEGQITMSRLEDGYDLTLAGVSFDGYTMAKLVLIG